ncbi:uncharacterized protein [Setaria viridis]|uniref:uncharacterized protein n=1 Tax=Setaria viridis TaxID=4556 RepID=UPI003B3B5015
MENPANIVTDEDYSTKTKVIHDLQSIKQPTNMKEDIPYSMGTATKDGEEPNESIIDDEPYDDDGVVYEEDTDEEGNIFSGQAEWEDIEVQINENESTVPEHSNINDPYDLVYSNIPDNTHKLKPVENCKYCDAKKFHHEPEGLCCRKGQIKLANLETPHQLMRLWTSNDSDAIHFRKNIRFFNGHFSFTSLYCHLDRDTTTMRNSGIYTFRAHGQIYHNIRSFGKDGSDPKHLELYFYDDDPSLEHRYRYCRKEMYEQDKHVLLIITNTLRNNPYSEQFRTLGQEENIEEYRVMLNLDQRLDQRTYNAPITSEVAAVWVEGNERRNTFDRNVILHGNNNEIQGIRSYAGCYDPLSYPLFFPRGELGWHADIPKVGITTEDVKKARANKNNKNNDPDSSGRLWVTMREYYCYKFHVRPNIFNPILYGGRLFQQFAVDTYIKIESSRLDFIWNHQKEIRADLYQGLLDSIHAGQDRGDAVGKRTVLSSSFIGGPRDKMRRYLDAMALVRKYGKPDIFLTMTCNPNWEEITNELEVGQTPQDRPDLVVRVFRAKLEEMKKELLEKHMLGKVKAYTYVVEFQKRGTTCYEDLRTVDGQILPSFREAAEKRGLIEADNTLDDCLTEAELFRMPSSLRRLFATILVFCEPHDIRALWNNHIEAMSEDYRRNCKNAKMVEQMVLINIREMLQSMGKDIRSFPLPEINEQNDTKDNTPREITEEANIEVDPDDMELPKHLNDEQKAAYNEILTAIDRDEGGLFFVDGPGGTGKTFLYRALLATVRGQGKIALATATSGVAASIMPGGRTAHSRFKIPLRIDDGAICSFTKQSGTAKLLQTASLIIWDEASMTKRQAIEALDKSMRDIMDIPNLPFGGKTVVFGGDFRQVLPVVRKGTRSQIVDASLRKSELWNCMRHMKLVRNMRAQNDPWFAEYLLRIGNGTEETNDKGEIRLPKNICIPRTMDDSGLDRLIDSVYQMNSACLEDPNYITSRAILSTRNDCVDRINLKMIERFQGEEMVYHSFDSVEDDPHNYYPPEFLNTLTPNGLPPHMLKLKINCPIILLRNIDPANGLCNGTRLVVRGFQKNAIDAEIVLGQHYGTRVFLPRIPLCPSDDEMFPFRFKRKQFPGYKLQQVDRPNSRKIVEE